MLTRIIVGLDGSPLAELALPYATLLARRSGANLTLVRAVPVSDGTSQPWRGDRQWSGDRRDPPELRAEEEWALTRAENAVAHTYLHRVGDDLARQGIVVDAHLAMGDPAEVLLEVSARERADLIVLSTHGRSGLGRLLFGSVAEAVLARSAVPVFLARAGQPDRAAELAAGGARLLVPLDGSARAEAALPLAETLARLFAAELSLMRIVDVIPVAVGVEGMGFGYPFPPTPEEGTAAATDYLEAVSGRLRADGLAATPRVRVDYPTDGIVAAEEETGASLVVMATHGPTGLVDSLLGSVARHVLRVGSRPVVLVPRPSR